jgi:hypothetical protein
MALDDTDQQFAQRLRVIPVARGEVVENEFDVFVGQRVTCALL